jgi:hypothetical protein
MNAEKQKHLALIIVAAAILVTVNVGIWLAAKHGAIASIENLGLWTAFAGLNVVTLVWAVSLLGLHPLIVALSYVAGGFLAFKGVESIPNINLAAITTAGATYGAFGALTVCNFTAKVRLAFFNKRQVPFIFIIVALLVFDAVLSSEISSADGNVVLNALVFPFLLAGVVIGLVWSTLNRYGIGCKVEPARGMLAVRQPDTMVDELEESEEPEESNTLKIQIPAHIEEDEDVAEVAAAMEETDIPELSESPAEETVKPIVAQEEKEEDFFPLEIDRGDEDHPALEETYVDTEKAADADSLDEDHLVREGAYVDIETAADTDSLDEDPFSPEGFDINLYASALDEIDSGGDVMIEDHGVSLALDLNETAAVELAEISPVAEEEQPEEFKPSVQAESEQRKSGKSDDWLSGHLDLLNKLK